jgi:hypothetical protein
MATMDQNHRLGFFVVTASQTRRAPQVEAGIATTKILVM